MTGDEVSFPTPEQRLLNLQVGGYIAPRAIAHERSSHPLQFASNVGLGVGLVWAWVGTDAGTRLQPGRDQDRPRQRPGHAVLQAARP